MIKNMCHETWWVKMRLITQRSVYVIFRKKCSLASCLRIVSPLQVGPVLGVAAWLRGGDFGVGMAVGLLVHYSWTTHFAGCTVEHWGRCLEAGKPSTAVHNMCAQSCDCLCVVVSVGSMCCAEAGDAVARLSGSFRSWSDCVVGWTIWNEFHSIGPFTVCKLWKHVSCYMYFIESLFVVNYRSQMWIDVGWFHYIYVFILVSILLPVLLGRMQLIHKMWHWFTGGRRRRRENTSHADDKAERRRKEQSLGRTALSKSINYSRLGYYFIGLLFLNIYD